MWTPRLGTARRYLPDLVDRGPYPRRIGRRDRSSGWMARGSGVVRRKPHGREHPVRRDDLRERILHVRTAVGALVPHRDDAGRDVTGHEFAPSVGVVVPRSDEPLLRADGDDRAAHDGALPFLVTVDVDLVRA